MRLIEKYFFKLLKIGLSVELLLTAALPAQAHSKLKVTNPFPSGRSANGVGNREPATGNTSRQSQEESVCSFPLPRKPEGTKPCSSGRTLCDGCKSSSKTNLFPIPYSLFPFKDAILLKQIISQQTFRPPKQGKPKDTSGAGSRDGLRCSQQDSQIQPLMPKQNYGLTLQEHPTIFVNLPKTSAQQVVLMFRDETGEFYERAFLPINGKAGIVGFTLPKQKQPLAVGKNYQWSLVVVCNETVQPDDPVVTGWVQRVARTSQMESELRQKTAIEQVGWYGARGYWYDMLNAIMQARRSHPHDANLVALWRKLLESEGLGTPASKLLK